MWMRQGNKDHHNRCMDQLTPGCFYLTDVSYAVALGLSERRPGFEIPTIIDFLHINPSEPKSKALV